MRSPAVSVVMTAYNRADCIAAAIESVLVQTYPDFELIVSDNCSTDGTLEIARQYARLDSRIRIHEHSENIGQFPNRNFAVTLVRAPMFKYHDSDDVMYPHCLEVGLSMLRSEPRAAFGLSAAPWTGGPCPMLLTPRLAYEREFLGAGMFNPGPAAALFRTDAFRELGGWVDVGSPSDYLFWVRACARVEVLLLPADLFWYRIHPGQLLQAPASRFEDARAAGIVTGLLQASTCPLDGAARRTAIRNHTFNIARSVFRNLRAGQWKLAVYRMRESGLTPREWLTHLRRPSRHFMAGTPMSANGDYIVPSILTLASKAQVSTRQES